MSERVAEMTLQQAHAIVAAGRAYTREHYSVDHPDKFVGQTPAAEYEAAVDRLVEGVDELMTTLRSARAEIDRWGYGDMHYGNTPRDRGVLVMLAEIDGVLDD